MDKGELTKTVTNGMRKSHVEKIKERFEEKDKSCDAPKRMSISFGGQEVSFVRDDVEVKTTLIANDEAILRAHLRDIARLFECYEMCDVEIKVKPARPPHRVYSSAKVHGGSWTMPELDLELDVL